MDNTIFPYVALPGGGYGPDPSLGQLTPYVMTDSAGRQGEGIPNAQWRPLSEVGGTVGNYPTTNGYNGGPRSGTELMYKDAAGNMYQHNQPSNIPTYSSGATSYLQLASGPRLSNPGGKSTTPESVITNPQNNNLDFNAMKPGESVHDLAARSPTAVPGGPIIDQGNGPQQNTSGFNINPGLGNGFTTTQVGINDVQAKIDALKPQVAAISNPVTVNNTGGSSSAGSGGAYTPPVPTAHNETQTFITGVASDAATASASLDSFYKTQLDNVQKAIDSTNANIAAIQGKEGALSGPWQKTLEDQMSQQLGIMNQYQANQRLVDQLNSLVAQATDVQNTLGSMTGLAKMMNPRMTAVMNNIKGQMGVINSALTAGRDQINQAYTIIDKTVAAITADNKDQMTYYQSLITSDEKNLVNLQADQKTFVAGQLKALQDNVNQAQISADAIKKLMIDPKSALAVAQAGVTLGDSVETINQKLATQALAQSRTDLVNSMAGKGYDYIATPAQAKLYPANRVVTTVDANGNTMYFAKTASTSSTTPPGTTGLTKAQYEKLSTAGIPTAFADALTAEILSGTSLDTIRQTLRAHGQDPAILDHYDNAVGIHNILKIAKPPKAAGGFQ